MLLEILPRLLAVVLLAGLIAATNVVQRDCAGDTSWHFSPPFLPTAPAGCQQHTWLRVQLDH